MKLSTLFLLCTGAAGVAFGDVPDSFVEYVESVNKTLYLNTGICPSPKTTRMMMKIALTEVSGTQQALFGAGNGWGNNNWLFVHDCGYSFAA